MAKHCPQYIWWNVLLLATLQYAAVHVLTESSDQSNTYCVKSEGGRCPDWCRGCSTLGNISQYFKSHTTIFFLEGNHHLVNSERLLVRIENVTNFTMEGKETANFNPNDDNPELESKIICRKNGGGLYFLNSKNLSIRRLAIMNCGIDVTFEPDNFTVHAAVLFRTSQNVTLFQVFINHSRGYGLQVDNVYGFFSIQDSVFMWAKAPRKNVFSGNARFWYFNATCETSLKIDNSSFKYGRSYRKKGNLPDGSGLSLIIRSPLVNVAIRKINASHNNARNGANIAFVITDYYENTSTISIKDSFIGYGVANKGAGLMCYIRLHYKYIPESCNTAREANYRSHFVVNVSNTDFHSNKAESGGAVYIHQHQIGYIDCTLRHIWFMSSEFKNNTSQNRGAAVAIIKFQILEIFPHNSPQFSVEFQKCIFFNNHYTVEEKLVKGSVMALIGAERVRIEESNFIQNKGSAISLINSNVIFSGNILFKENHALYGGALKLCDSSTIYLKKRTYVKFVQNFANFSGGAIYAEQRCMDIDPPCFYQPGVSRLDITQLRETMRLEFINNTALVAGQAVYGGSVGFCYTIYHVKGFSRNNTIFQAISNLDQQPGPSKVTSDPYGVCFCNSSTNDSHCEEINRKIQLYPGASFSISASAVGQMNGVVPSRIEVQNRDTQDKDTYIVPKFESGYGGKPVVCHTVHISVHTKRPVVTLDLIVEQVNQAVESGSSFRLSKRNITVSLSKCPWIFEITKQLPYECKCAALLLHKKVQCDINTVSFGRPKSSIWIGCEQKNDSRNFTDFGFDAGHGPPACRKVYYGDNCLDEYCSNATNLTPSNLSAQCKDRREKILCGACIENSSLTLGIPQCVDNENCTYWKTFILFFVFLTSGALLVLFLALFNITVSEGTVGGLLFYANFVHANYKFFFPVNARSPIADVFRIFIAWLNLDFGLEVCFYAGMDAYQKVWLEFGFLFYLLLLGLLIIYSSHKFICVTRLVGRNVVSVLSTIILFSYSKLVRTSVKALEFTYLEIYDYSRNQKIPVWKEDGNVDYFQGKHIPLAIVAIVLCTIAFFYMLCLLFIQCLQRRSNWCILRWVNKLRPFFDANTGPCRDHYRFWPGFLLFARFLLFWIYSLVGTRLENKLYFLLAFCVFIFILACISPNGVYKKWPLNILEFSFFLNLGFLSGLVVTVVLHKDVPTLAFTFPSVGIAAITFGFIILFHGYKRVSRTRRWSRYVTWIRNRSSRQGWGSIQGNNNNPSIYSETDERDVNERTPILGQRIPPVVHFDRLRESLLAED